MALNCRKGVANRATIRDLERFIPISTFSTAQKSYNSAKSFQNQVYSLIEKYLFEGIYEWEKRNWNYNSSVLKISLVYFLFLNTRLDSFKFYSVNTKILQSSSCNKVWYIYNTSSLKYLIISTVIIVPKQLFLTWALIRLSIRTRDSTKKGA